LTGGAGPHIVLLARPPAGLCLPCPETCAALCRVPAPGRPVPGVPV